MTTPFAASLRDSDILVTGGTGFTGTHLIRKLVEAGARVRCIARPTSRIPDGLETSVLWIRGDVYDPAIVKTAVAGVQYIFHVAACFREADASELEYDRVHVLSTQLLAEAAVAQNGFKRFVHVSTMGVHGHIENPPANEKYRFAPGDVYQRTKLKAELWIRSFAADRDLQVSVVRPAAIIGPGDKRLLKLFRFARSGWFPLLDGHNVLYHLVHVDDLTDFMMLVATHQDAIGEVFLCGNEEPTNVKQILTQIGEILGKQVRFVPIPAKPLFALAGLIEDVALRLKVNPPIYRRRVSFFTKDRALDTSHMTAVTGFTCAYDNKTAIENTARDYLERGWL